MRKILIVAAVVEAVTGLILLADPAVVVRLLFGEAIVGAGVVMSRIAGISLVALGVACWPIDGTTRALYGMLTYNALSMIYLTFLGARGQEVRSLLWLAVGVHAILAGLLVRARLERTTKVT